MTARVCIAACIALVPAAIANAGAVNVPVDLEIDSSRSPLTVTVSALGDSDSDSTEIDGNAIANLTMDPTGGTPLIEGIEFTGGTLGTTSSLDLSLTVIVVIPLTVDIAVEDVMGFVATPDPPAPVTANAPDALNYDFDASFHSVTLNEGALVVTGVVDQMLNLADEPVVGSAPEGTLGTLALSPTDGPGLLDHFDIELVLPVEFADTVPVDTPLGAISVDIAISGTAVANGSFAIDLNPADPADFDKDGDVDGEDFLIWQANFFTAAGATSNTGDADGDGDVDGEDFLVWQVGFSGGGTGGGHSIPEPATVWGIVLSAAAWAGRRGRRVG